jgi:hypothetical protein
MASKKTKEPTKDELIAELRGRIVRLEEELRQIRAIHSRCAHSTRIDPEERPLPVFSGTSEPNNLPDVRSRRMLEAPVTTSNYFPALHNQSKRIRRTKEGQSPVGQQTQALPRITPLADVTTLSPCDRGERVERDEETLSLSSQQCQSLPRSTVQDTEKGSDQGHHRRKLNKLIARTPNAQHWEQQFRQSGLYDAVGSGYVLEQLLQSLNLTTVNLTVPWADSQRDAVEVTVSSSTQQEADLIHRLQELARHNKHLQRVVRLTDSIAELRKLVLLSACVVLREKCQYSYESLKPILSLCLDDTEQVTDDVVMRTLRAVRFLNEMIETMAMHGWFGRAAEMLLFCKLPHSLLVQQSG